MAHPSAKCFSNVRRESTSEFFFKFRSLFFDQNSEVEEDFRSRRWTILSLCLFCFIAVNPIVEAGPICYFSVEPPLYDLVADADHVALANRIDFAKGDKKTIDQTTFQVIEVAKGAANVEVGQQFKLRGAWKDEHQLFLLIHKGKLNSEWKSIPISSRASLRFLTNTPPKKDTHARLKYFAGHLCSDDPTINEEAVTSFNEVAYSDIRHVAEHLPFAKIRGAMDDTSIKPSKLRQYALLLGLSGESRDAKLMQELIQQSLDAEKPSGAIDGILSSYLLLAGDQGLDWVENKILKRTDLKYVITYAGIMALRFMWHEGQGQISTERLAGAARLVLEHTALADLVILDLAKWDDWSVHGKLMLLYEHEGAEWARVPIVRYMMASMNVPPEVRSDKIARFELGMRYYQEIAASDAKSIKRVKTFFPSNGLNFISRIDMPKGATKESEKAGDDPLVAELKQRGATVFLSKGQVVEVSANRAMFSDDTLKLIGRLPTLTDLSLEQTSVTDKGIEHLRGLQKLEWLNLYRTNIGDEGLKILKDLESLTLLPIGETKVTGKGLVHLKDMTQLEYLGLRGNDIHDADLANLAMLTGLTSLYLGETKIMGNGLQHLKGLRKLKTLWINNTGVGDDSIDSLAELKSLQTLEIYDSKFTAEGVQKLRARLPACRVIAERPE